MRSILSPASDLTRNFKLEVDTGKMVLVAGAVAYRRRASRMDQRTGMHELGHAKAVSVWFFIGFVFVRP